MLPRRDLWILAILLVLPVMLGIAGAYFLPGHVLLWISGFYVLAFLFADVLIMMNTDHVGKPDTVDGIIHQRGKAVSAIAPEGKVRVGNELWNARCHGELEIPEGSMVRIIARHGLWITVESEDGTPSPGDA